METGLGDVDGDDGQGDGGADLIGDAEHGVEDNADAHALGDHHINDNADAEDEEDLGDRSPVALLHELGEGGALGHLVSQVEHQGDQNEEGDAVAPGVAEAAGNAEAHARLGGAHDGGGPDPGHHDAGRHQGGRDASARGDEVIHALYREFLGDEDRDPDEDEREDRQDKIAV